MPTYVEMFEDWLGKNAWAKPTDPLVFHLRKLCVAMDGQFSEKGEASGPLNSSYLQAWRLLEKSQPGATGPAPLPGQTSIFDPGFG